MSKRRLSKEGRAAISRAAKARWSAYRKNGAGARRTKSKRRSAPARSRSPEILRDVLKEVIKESFGL